MQKATYTLADLTNGAFGDTFDTYEAACAAYTEMVAEYLDEEVEYLRVACESIPSSPADPDYDFLTRAADAAEADDDEYLKIIAKERIESFLSIEEVI